MNRTRWVLLTAIALLFLIVLTYVVVVIYIPSQQPPLPEGVFGAAAAESGEIHATQNNARFLTLVAVMLAGVFASYIFEVAKNAGPTINLPAELAKMISSSRLIMALVVSPIIFNSVYIAIGSNPENFGDYLLAFQNGFFWEAILSGLSRQQDSL